MGCEDVEAPADSSGTSSSLMFHAISAGASEIGPEDEEAGSDKRFSKNEMTDNEKHKKDLREGSLERTGVTAKWDRLGQVGVHGTGGTGTGGSSDYVGQDGTGTGGSFSWTSPVGLQGRQKFITRQRTRGENHYNDSENSWIPDGLPSSSTEKEARGGGKEESGERSGVQARSTLELTTPKARSVNKSLFHLVFFVFETIWNFPLTNFSQLCWDKSWWENKRDMHTRAFVDEPSQEWKRCTLAGHERVDPRFLICLVVHLSLLRFLSTQILV